MSFTVKFRLGPDDAWKWVNDTLARRDGQLYYHDSSEKKRHLSHYIEGISADLDVAERTSEVPGTLLWSVTAPIEAAAGRESGYSAHALGKPTNFSRWFSLVRLWTPWLAPRHGQELFRPDKEAILSAFLRYDGLHVVMLAVSGVDDLLSVLTHDGHGSVVIAGRNDRDTKGSARILIAVGDSFEAANAAVMYQARHLVTQFAASTGEISLENEVMQRNDPQAQWLQDWYDGLTYCTWNGLGQRLTAERIYNALDELEKNDIKSETSIISFGVYHC